MQNNNLIGLIVTEPNCNLQVESQIDPKANNNNSQICTYTISSDVCFEIDDPNLEEKKVDDMTMDEFSQFIQSKKNQSHAHFVDLAAVRGNTNLDVDEFFSLQAEIREASTIDLRHNLKFIQRENHPRRISYKPRYLPFNPDYTIAYLTFIGAYKNMVEEGKVTHNWEKFNAELTNWELFYEALNKTSPAEYFSSDKLHAYYSMASYPEELSMDNFKKLQTYYKRWGDIIDLNYPVYLLIRQTLPITLVTVRSEKSYEWDFFDTECWRLLDLRDYLYTDTPFIYPQGPKPLKDFAYHHWVSTSNYKRMQKNHKEGYIILKTLDKNKGHFILKSKFAQSAMNHFNVFSSLISVVLSTNDLVGFRALDVSKYDYLVNGDFFGIKYDEDLYAEAATRFSKAIMECNWPALFSNFEQIHKCRVEFSKTGPDHSPQFTAFIQTPQRKFESAPNPNKKNAKEEVTAAFIIELLCNADTHVINTVCKKLDVATLPYNLYTLIEDEDAFNSVFLDNLKTITEGNKVTYSAFGLVQSGTTGSFTETKFKNNLVNAISTEMYRMDRSETFFSQKKPGMNCYVLDVDGPKQNDVALTDGITVFVPTKHEVSNLEYLVVAKDPQLENKWLGQGLVGHVGDVNPDTPNTKIEEWGRHGAQRCHKAKDDVCIIYNNCFQTWGIVCYAATDKYCIVDYTKFNGFCLLPAYYMCVKKLVNFTIGDTRINPLKMLAEVQGQIDNYVYECFLENVSAPTKYLTIDVREYNSLDHIKHDKSHVAIVDNHAFYVYVKYTTFKGSACDAVAGMQRRGGRGGNANRGGGNQRFYNNNPNNMPQVHAPQPRVNQNANQQAFIPEDPNIDFTVTLSNTRGISPVTVTTRSGQVNLDYITTPSKVNYCFVTSLLAYATQIPLNVQQALFMCQCGVDDESHYETIINYVRDFVPDPVRRLLFTPNYKSPHMDVANTVLTLMDATHQLKSLCGDTNVPLSNWTYPVVIGYFKNLANSSQTWHSIFRAIPIKADGHGHLASGASVEPTDYSVVVELQTAMPIRGIDYSKFEGSTFQTFIKAYRNWNVELSQYVTLKELGSWLNLLMVEYHIEQGQNFVKAGKPNNILVYSDGTLRRKDLVVEDIPSDTDSSEEDQIINIVKEMIDYKALDKGDFDFNINCNLDTAHELTKVFNYEVEIQNKGLSKTKPIKTLEAILLKLHFDAVVHGASLHEALPSVKSRKPFSKIQTGTVPFYPSIIHAPHVNNLPLKFMTIVVEKASNGRTYPDNTRCDWFHESYHTPESLYYRTNLPFVKNGESTNPLPLYNIGEGVVTLLGTKKYLVETLHSYSYGTTTNHVFKLLNCSLTDQSATLSSEFCKPLPSEQAVKLTEWFNIQLTNNKFKDYSVNMIVDQAANYLMACHGGNAKPQLKNAFLMIASATYKTIIEERNLAAIYLNHKRMYCQLDGTIRQSGWYCFSNNLFGYVWRKSELMRDWQDKMLSVPVEEGWFGFARRIGRNIGASLACAISGKWLWHYKDAIKNITPVQTIPAYIKKHDTALAHALSYFGAPPQYSLSSMKEIVETAKAGGVAAANLSVTVVNRTSTAINWLTNNLKPIIKGTACILFGLSAYYLIKTLIKPELNYQTNKVVRVLKVIDLTSVYAHLDMELNPEIQRFDTSNPEDGMKVRVYYEFIDTDQSLRVCKLAPAGNVYSMMLPTGNLIQKYPEAFGNWNPNKNLVKSKYYRMNGTEMSREAFEEYAINVEEDIEPEHLDLGIVDQTAPKVKEVRGGILSIKHALIDRHLATPVQPDKTTVLDWLDWCKNELRDIRSVANLVKPMTWSEYIESVEPRKRRLYENGKEKALLNGRIPVTMKIMAKRFESHYGDDEPKPRNICNPSNQYKFWCGHFCKWALDVLMHWKHPNISFAVARKPDEFADLIRNYWVHDDHIEIDGSKFDSTQHAENRQLDVWFIEHLFDIYISKTDTPSYLVPALKKALTIVENTLYINYPKSRNKLAEFRIRGTVYSGMACTTLGNCLRQSTYYAYILHKAGVRDYKMLCAGDDILINAHRSDIAKFTRIMPDYVLPDHLPRKHGLGQVVKEISITRTPRFLSKVIYKDGSYHRFLNRMYLKGWTIPLDSLKFLTVEQFNYAFTSSLEHDGLNIPLIEAQVAYRREVLTHQYTRSTIDDEYRMNGSHLQVNVLAKFFSQLQVASNLFPRLDIIDSIIFSTGLVGCIGGEVNSTSQNLMSNNQENKKAGNNSNSGSRKQKSNKKPKLDQKGLNGILKLANQLHDMYDVSSPTKALSMYDKNSQMYNGAYDQSLDLAQQTIAGKNALSALEKAVGQKFISTTVKGFSNFKYQDKVKAILALLSDDIVSTMLGLGSKALPYIYPLLDKAVSFGGEKILDWFYSKISQFTDSNMKGHGSGQGLVVWPKVGRMYTKNTVSVASVMTFICPEEYNFPMSSIYTRHLATTGTRRAQILTSNAAGEQIIYVFPDCAYGSASLSAGVISGAVMSSPTSVTNLSTGTSTAWTGVFGPLRSNINNANSFTTTGYSTRIVTNLSALNNSGTITMAYLFETPTDAIWDPTTTGIANFGIGDTTLQNLPIQYTANLVGTKEFNMCRSCADWTIFDEFSVLATAQTMNSDIIMIRVSGVPANTNYATLYLTGSTDATPSQSGMVVNKPKPIPPAPATIEFIGMLNHIVPNWSFQPLETRLKLANHLQLCESEDFDELARHLAGHSIDLTKHEKGSTIIESSPDNGFSDLSFLEQ